MKLALLAIPGLLFLGCAAKPYIVDYSGETNDSAKNEVHVVSHGWHTGFVIPVASIHKKLPELKQRFSDVPYIEFGWGDKGFYQASEITSGLTLKAIFWPSESVVHAVAVQQKADSFFPGSEIESLCLSDSELSSLITFIAESFYRDSSGEIQAMDKGIYGDSQFYKAVGSYYLMNTCNKWTAKGLKSVGMDISPLLKLTAGSVMSYLRERRLDLSIESGVTPGSVLGCR